MAVFVLYNDTPKHTDTPSTHTHTHTHTRTDTKTHTHRHTHANTNIHILTEGYFEQTKEIKSKRKAMDSTILCPPLRRERKGVRPDVRGKP